MCNVTHPKRGLGASAELCGSGYLSRSSAASSESSSDSFDSAPRRSFRASSGSRSTLTDSSGLVLGAMSPWYASERLGRSWLVEQPLAAGAPDKARHPVSVAQIASRVAEVELMEVSLQVGAG